MIGWGGCASIDDMIDAVKRMPDRNGGKTEGTRCLMWKTADTYLIEALATAPLDPF